MYLICMICTPSQTTQLPANGTSGKLLPVMFWIHGGAFSLGQAIEYVPTRYMDYDIVLVVIQYRLGPLGQIIIECNFYNNSPLIPPT